MSDCMAIKNLLDAVTAFYKSEDIKDPQGLWCPQTCRMQRPFEDSPAHIVHIHDRKCSLHDVTDSDIKWKNKPETNKYSKEKL